MSSIMHEHPGFAAQTLEVTRAKAHRGSRHCVPEAAERKDPTGHGPHIQPNPASPAVSWELRGDADARVEAAMKCLWSERVESHF